MLLRLPPVRLTRRRMWAGGAATVLVVGLITWMAWPTPRGYTTVDQVLTVLSGPGGDDPVRLDTPLYLPTAANPAHPAAAILLAHGFGGTKASVASDAADFARHGYAVLAYTARGFGRSGDQIH